MAKNEIAVYQPSKTMRLEVMLRQDTVWLNRQQLAQLFGRDIKTIGKHIANALQEELAPVVAEFATTAADGKIYQVEYYNLEMITSIGYRVKSPEGVMFRRWANRVLKEYLMRGYAVNARLNQLEDKVDRRLSKTEQDVIELKEQIGFFVKTAVIVILSQCILGCTTYKMGMSHRDRIITRFEQNCLLDGEDSKCGSKIVKHVILDFFSFGLAEIWYHRVRVSYYGVMEDERGWTLFVQSVKGHIWTDVAKRIGVPTRKISTGDGRTMMVYESRSMENRGNFSGTVNQLGMASGNFNSVSDESINQTWLIVDEKNVVIDVKRNWKRIGASPFPGSS